MFRKELNRRLNNAISMRKEKEKKAFWCGKVCAFREVLRLYDKIGGNNMRVFKRKPQEEQLQYPDDIKVIRAYLENIGELFVVDSVLDKLWREFSNDVYCAQFMGAAPQFIEEFACWLENHYD